MSDPVDPVVRRQAAYLRKVLPPEPGGSFDIVTGEAYLEPPTDDRDPEVMRGLAEVALAEVVNNEELKAELDELAASLASEPELENPPEIPGGGIDVQYRPAEDEKVGSN